MTTAEIADDASDRTGPASVAAVVVAAGGVVLDDSTGVLRVLVVHRPTYDDWSLPKGHVDEGEGPTDAAIREVAEETGVRAHVTREAGTTEHTVTSTRAGTTQDVTKRVHWFTMRPTDDAQDPADRIGDDEVDIAAWWGVDRALVGLTHASERQLLARVLDVRVSDGDLHGVTP